LHRAILPAPAAATLLSHRRDPALYKAEHNRPEIHPAAPSPPGPIAESVSPSTAWDFANRTADSTPSPAKANQYASAPQGLAPASVRGATRTSSVSIAASADRLAGLDCARAARELRCPIPATPAKLRLPDLPSAPNVHSPLCPRVP